MLGRDPGARELRARVGIVLQSCGTYPYLTVRETLDHWASLYPHPRRVDEVLALAGLDECADRRARTLSGGQARRLDFALALVGDPELIFLDEPTTGFDPAARRAAWDVIRALKALGKTVVLTTHYLDEAQALADRVAILQDGLILAEGPPDSLGASRYRVAWRAADGTLEERFTEDPTALLHTLTADALARGETLEELSVTRPSLEDVYLESLTRPEVAPRDGACAAVARRGASSASSAGCSGATRPPRSSACCSRWGCWRSSARCSPAARRTST